MWLVIRLNNAGKWACDRFTVDADFGKKKIISSDEAHLDLGKFGKIAAFGAQKIRMLHWKADAPKRSHCLVRILVQRHNCDIFLRKWASRGHYSQLRLLSDHVERIFVHKNYLASTGRRYVPHSRSYTRCLTPFLMLFDHLGAAIWHSWTIIRVVPSKTKDNIREMQGHIIDMLQ